MFAKTFRTIFSAFLFATLVVNVIFHVSSKDDRRDAVGAQAELEANKSQTRRLTVMRRSNSASELASNAEAALASLDEAHESGAESKLLRAASQWQTATPKAIALDASSSLSSQQLLLKPQTASSKKDASSGRKRRLLNLKVKSSKDCVQVIANGLTIYKSANSEAQQTSQAASSTRLDASLSSGQAATSQAASSATQAGSGGGEAQNKRLQRDAATKAKRGLHVLALSQFDGSLLAKRVFDTYLPFADEELNLFVRLLRDNRIVVAAVLDEATLHMPRQSPARKLLVALGSAHIARLAWRDMWAFVARKVSVSAVSGGKLEANNARPFGEALSKAPQGGLGWPQRAAQVNVTIELDDEDDANGKCAWSALPTSGDDLRRSEFCKRVDGYGAVCDCDAPSQISFATRQIENSRLKNVPIVVMASDRPNYLFRMLRSLLVVDGVQPQNVIVFIDGHYEEPELVARLFNLRAVRHSPRGHRNARISHHYKSSLSAAFQMFANASHLLIFEEDLDVAQDALLYFNQTLPLLEQDSSLYCVSAWNDLGYEHSARDSSLLYRVESMPGLGWLLSRRLYKDELERSWPSSDNAHDWDMWIRTAAVRRKRECIVPDVSRTFHFGATGVNINSYFQRQYFASHAFAYDAGRIEFANLQNMTKDAYEQMLIAMIKRAHVVSPTDMLAAEAEHSAESDAEHYYTPTHPNAATANIKVESSASNDVASNFTDYICSLATSASKSSESAMHFENGKQARRKHQRKLQLMRKHQQLQQQISLQSGNQPPLNPYSSKHKPRAAQNRHQQNVESTNMAPPNTDNNNNDNINNANVIFIDMIDGRDYATWLNLAKCWRIWDLDARGQHNAMWRLFLNGVHTFVIGYPASPYSALKPPHVKPFKFNDQ